ncbi:class I SAM-dependent methyltransferase [Sinorhizobium meliloti]|uniref:SAM-dependent methyltransferase n=1 Tax=Rhizobium meliloti TaxID=382 RepID=UPI000FD9AC73|nr:cyclopropane-fatty-acyl-phospholipid synthase family protein [Sinorhizobium meliloti]MDE3795796.1 class I SAM-dependent methyltransferase [Sinorhizobium meliloti]RVK58271.1 class I SAM-dependent methyltransferase [Sinorhizobium meliloti]
MLFEIALTRLIKFGTLAVTFPDGRVREFGTGEGPSAAVAIKSRRAKRRLLLNPALGLGEAYMDGDLVPARGDVFGLLDFLALNTIEGGGHPFDKLMEKVRWFRRRIDQLNGADRSRRNVAHHYDLDGSLYSLILDQDQQYSCAYFPDGSESLEEAQFKKKRHIASKLKLDRPGLDVLDIGSGWGGMALFLAREYGARVTGLTLSTEQLSVARRRAAEAGLEDQVKFELVDYRAWSKPVDRIVSVGMFEHVGINHYHTFFAKMRDTLRDHGVGLIHAIGRNDGPGSTNPWIAKYIFPGGYSPALSEVLRSIEKSGLWTTDVEVLRLHYAKTLAHWRERFAASRGIFARIHDERFCRMFEFYLAVSELAFRRMGHMNWQLQFSPNLTTLPLSRDYMFRAEQFPVQTKVNGRLSAGDVGVEEDNRVVAER